MIKCFLLIIFLSYSITSNGMETRGILEPLETNTPVVGESYRYRLTLVPFEKHLIKVDQIEGKSFLDFFYVSELVSTSTSKNNVDAVIVVLDMVLVKKVDLQASYIWNLGARNIPIDVKRLEVKDVSLVQKNFALLKTENVSFIQEYTYTVGLSLLLLALALGWFLYKKSLRKGPLPKSKKSLKKLVLATSKKEDLEVLFIYRNEILTSVDEPLLKGRFQAFFDKYAKEQYSPDWRGAEVNSLIKEAKELGRGLNNGV